MDHLTTLTCLWSITTTYELTTLMSFLALVIMLLKSLGSSYSVLIRFPAAIFAPFNATPTWRLHTKPYKFGKNVFSNISHMDYWTDLVLGEAFVYLTSLISQILDSLYWLHGSVAFLFLMVWQWKHRKVISSGRGGRGGGLGYFFIRGQWGCARRMGSHFHHWFDYNGVAFSIRVTRIGLHIFGFFWVRKF